MSFKSRLIQHCRYMEKDCQYCSLREPCVKTDYFSVPEEWGDDKINEMLDNILDYMRDMSEKMSEISKLMLDASKDDVKDAEKRRST